MERQTVKIASAVLLIREVGEATQILLQKRGTGTRGAGNWDCSAAGHVEVGEAMTACAIREAAEEIGITFSESDVVFKTIVYSNNTDIGPYIGLYLFVKNWQGTPAVMEGDKCVALEWFDLDNLPPNLWPISTSAAIENFKIGSVFSELGWQG